MELTQEDRIEKLLQQLEDPNLTNAEIAKIKDKVAFLEAREQ